MPNDTDDNTNDNTIPGPDHPNPKALFDQQVERAQQMGNAGIAQFYATELQRQLDAEHRAALASNPPAELRRVTIHRIIYQAFVQLRHQLDVVAGN